MRRRAGGLGTLAASAREAARSRRDFLHVAGAAAAVSLAGAWSTRQAVSLGDAMYGLIGKMTAMPGKREALAGILLEGTRSMPGCLSYVVASDATDPDALWVTEVWDSAQSHQDSLTLPSVQEAIRRGRPLIAGFADRVETKPLGGHGLAAEP